MCGHIRLATFIVRERIALGHEKRGGGSVLVRLLVISFVTAAAIRAFEVGLSLRATQISNMGPYEIGLMFTECSLVMLVVQASSFRRS
jgi:hypothetical protein